MSARLNKLASGNTMASRAFSLKLVRKDLSTRLTDDRTIPKKKAIVREIILADLFFIFTHLTLQGDGLMTLWTEWLTLDPNTTWNELQDISQRFATFPQPLYTLPGPSYYADEKFILLSNQPFTADIITQILDEIYPPEDIADAENTSIDDIQYTNWINTWLAKLPTSLEE